MNAVYGLAARLKAGEQWKEKLAGGGLDNKQFNEYPQTKEATKGFTSARPATASPTRLHTARAQGRLRFGRRARRAQPRLSQYRPVQRGMAAAFQRADRRQARSRRSKSPIADKNSSYWKATENMTPDMALFFLKRAGRQAGRHALRQGASAQPGQARRGKIVFAENCARCHSSKQPPNLCMLGTPCKDGQIIENTAAYFDWMRNEVQKPDFLADNYPVDRPPRLDPGNRHQRLFSPLATNAIRDNIWDNFSSETYKELPATGTDHGLQPGRRHASAVRHAGRRARLCAAGLADQRVVVGALPAEQFGRLFQRRSVGRRPHGGVRGRHHQNAVAGEARQGHPGSIGIGDRFRGPSKILRTTQRSYIKVPAGYLPGDLDKIAGFFGILAALAGALAVHRRRATSQIGPIPEGTPVSLLANINPLSESTRPR